MVCQFASIHFYPFLSFPLFQFSFLFLFFFIFVFPFIFSFYFIFVSFIFVSIDKSVKHLKYSKKIYATRHSELSISDSYLLFSTKAHERIACSTHSSTVDAESSFTLTYLLFRSLALYPSNFTIKVYIYFFHLLLFTSFYF